MDLVVISLARAEERRAKISRRLEAASIPFRFFDAVDGRALTAAERALVDDDARRHVTPYPLSDGEIGCWLSHRRVLSAFVESGAEAIAVLEDDAAPLPGLAQVLQSLDDCATPFDFVDLHRTFRPTEAFIPCTDLCEGFRLGWVRYSQMRTTGYVMRRAGAQRLGAQSSRFVHAVDKTMKRWWANGLRYMVLDHPVIVQDEAQPSMIETGRTARPRYADADDLRYRLARFASRASDSVAKRWRFDSYVRQWKKKMYDA